ncbi:MAG: transposase [Deltaproteobacteria bacterium]|nr:transposase [Deltaproteobacteria bacterium]
MKCDLEKHNRRVIRLPGYDYSNAGAYFVTICTWDKECWFGKIIDGEMVLNKAGIMVENVWNDLLNHYSHMQLDQSTIMPNHFHGIIMLHDDVTPAPAASPKRHGLPEIIRGFKTFAARRINEMRHTQGTKLWQRNYYEHIVRNENELHDIRKYIQENPLKWELDRHYPGA